jgi:uncharacterized protein YndB with AHSA1/START domain
MTLDTIERELVVEAPIERVWAALTEAEHVGTWFGDAGAEVDLRPGGTMMVHWAEHGSVEATIVAVEPPRAFSYRWAPFRDPAGKTPVEGNSTLVEFTLAPRGADTLLRVTESGFDTLDCPDEQRLENLAGNTEGWQIELGHLEQHLRQATSVGAS